MEDEEEEAEQVDGGFDGIHFARSCEMVPSSSIWNGILVLY